MDDFDPENVINAREAFAPPKAVKREPTVDIPLSKAVGKKMVIGTPDHRKAVKIINEWNRKTPDVDANNVRDWRPVDYLKDENKVKQLKKEIYGY